MNITDVPVKYIPQLLNFIPTDGSRPLSEYKVGSGSGPVSQRCGSAALDAVSEKIILVQT